jgi:hypothetical protein
MPRSRSRKKCPKEKKAKRNVSNVPETLKEQEQRLPFEIHKIQAVQVRFRRPIPRRKAFLKGRKGKKKIVFFLLISL